VDRPAEALLDELGHEARVVDVGVRQQERVDLAGGNRKAVPVAELEFPLLKQAAIDHHLLAGDREDILAAGDLPTGAEEVELHGEGDRRQETGDRGHTSPQRERGFWVLLFGAGLQTSPKG
jgi:hypothetical protein